MTMTQALVKEISGLPVERQGEVLAFVRFLKVGLATRTTLDRRCDKALTAIRASASRRGITPRVIAREIAAARTPG